MRILSLGGGVQSTVMCLLAEEEAFGYKPDYAIFADTHWEPSAVYENLDWLKNQVSFPVLTTDNGRSLREDVRNGVNAQGKPWLTLPVFLSDESGENVGINWRQCTKNYKLDPIRRKVQDLLGVNPREQLPSATWVEMWLGITHDEILRVKNSRNWWVKHRYPLVDDVPMTREDCQTWFAERYPDRYLGRSACVGCPFRSSKSWLEIKKYEPVLFDEAVEIDQMLRSNGHNASEMFRKNAYLHHRMMPLDEAINADLEEFDDDGFINECEGYCGI